MYLICKGGRSMNIKPSASIRNNYNEISALCKSTGEPVYLTKNGEGDLVVMDIDVYKRQPMSWTRTAYAMRCAGGTASRWSSRTFPASYSSTGSWKRPNA